jgi:hypothetical protein
MKILLLFLISLTAHARGGVDIGDGADQHSESSATAWFLGRDKTIQACIELSKDFGVSKVAAKETIQNAFGQWFRY